MEIKDLIGKTIKKINVDFYDGCLILFEDGSIVSIKTRNYAEGGYDYTYAEEHKYKDVKEYLGEEE